MRSACLAVSLFLARMPIAHTQTGRTVMPFPETGELSVL